MSEWYQDSLDAPRRTAMSPSDQNQLSAEISWATATPWVFFWVYNSDMNWEMNHAFCRLNSSRFCFYN